MSEASSASARDERRSPFQGLVPYGEADAEWFFGRREWTEIVIDNLRAYRSSILYGASGVGKSSVLNAGVDQRPPHAGGLERRRDGDAGARGRAVRARGAATIRSRRCRRPSARPSS